jgi:hypothetical protein
MTGQLTEDRVEELRVPFGSPRPVVMELSTRRDVRSLCLRRHTCAPDLVERIRQVRAVLSATTCPAACSADPHRSPRRSPLPTAPSTHSRRSPDTPAVPPGGAPALHRPITRHPNPLSRTNVDGIATGLLSDIPHPCPVRPATRPGWPEACGSARPAHAGGVPSSVIAAARRAVIAASIACTADSSPMSSTSAPAPPAGLPDLGALTAPPNKNGHRARDMGYEDAP